MSFDNTERSVPTRGDTVGAHRTLGAAADRAVGTDPLVSSALRHAAAAAGGELGTTPLHVHPQPVDSQPQNLGIPSLTRPALRPERKVWNGSWLMASDVCKHCTHAHARTLPHPRVIHRVRHGRLVQQDICNGCGSPACLGVPTTPSRGAEMHPVLRPAPPAASSPRAPRCVATGITLPWTSRGPARLSGARHAPRGLTQACFTATIRIYGVGGNGASLPVTR